MRVLIVPDKFKGTLTARAAADAIAAGWRRARPADRLDLLPLCDGGDGFGEVMGFLLGARPVRTRTVDAAHRPVTAVWWWDARTRTAVIESARVIGLAMLPRGRFHPFALDTRGLGAVLRAAARRGARRCLVGIGGSATNDGGFGLARALGWKFFDAAGEEITRWTELRRLARLQPPARRRRFNELIVAVDVQNPLLGPRGASRIYGPQKGLRPADLAPAEANLRRLAAVVQRQFGHARHREAGAGAAGGLGFGLRTFAGGRFAPGFDLYARLAGLRKRLRAAEVIVTAEGRLDRSSLMGKGPGGVAALARRIGRPCVGIGGTVGDRAALRRRFTAVHALAPDLVPLAEAMRHPARSLRAAAERIAAAWRE
ncbi:MAG: glycerate kinase [Candidatus Brachytrichaceae bacterium NZ_4S206]|jgi:glycerate kinase